MRISVLAVALCGLLGTALPAVAEDPTPNNAPDPNEKICLAMPPPSGSRISAGTVCHTRQEWDTLRRSGADELELYNRTTPISNASSGAQGNLGGMRPH